MTDVNRRFFDALMQEKKLSMRGLAAKMGMNHSQLSLTFSGARKMQIDEAVQISQIFGVPLYKVIEAAGVSVRPPSRRAPVIGAVKGDGTVEMHPKGVIERTAAPEELPDDTVAVQCRTAGSPLEWMDGWVMFCRTPEDMSHGHLGCMCLAQIKGGPVVLALVHRGYRDGTNNLRGPFHQENASLEWATPIRMTRH